VHHSKFDRRLASSLKSRHEDLWISELRVHARSKGPKGLGKQRRTAVGELHVRAALVPPQPAERNSSFNPGAELIAAAASRQKRF